ncbi:MAG: hypothetical protein GX757_01850 [Clostridiales bacterium]|nr:hypothetical protein [Clostridiales bacterium]
MTGQVLYNDVELNKVSVQDPYYVNAFEKEIEYLKSLDADRLLAGFRQVKRLKAKAEVYGGWENTEIKGHTLGHYLTAVAQAYAATKDNELLKRVHYMIDELAESQLESGFLFASGEYLFDNVEQGKPAWVPWYTMHKIFEGLIAAYRLTGYRKAYEVFDRLADWVYDRTSRWDEELNLRVLKVEYGGMNDCLYDVYSFTGKEKHLIAAHKFDEMALFSAIRDGKDILNNLHANTTIPKFVGAMKRYMVVEGCEPFYLEACEGFWDMVVEHHSYVTGGNSEWEHFGPPDKLDCERTSCNCETCNTYNMLKLSKGLYQITGKKKYLDFYENTLINAILSSQNPETGMTMYFQPMATGYFKVYSTPYDKFWCCTGTGMENFTKLNDAIYYTREDNGVYEITVGRYVSSELTLEDMPLKLKMEAGFPYDDYCRISLPEVSEGQRLVIRLRIPDWSCSRDLPDVNGSREGIYERDGFIYLDRNWSKNDLVNIRWQMTVTYHDLPDNPHSIAFKYGPVVLSAGLGTEDMTTSKTGVNVTIPTKNIDIKDYILVKGMTVEQWLSRLPEHLIRKPGSDRLEFVLRNTDEDDRLVFSPHFMRYKDRYGIYFVIFDENSQDYKAHLEEEERKRLLELNTIDIIPVGNDQYELKHEIKGENTFADTGNGYIHRGAHPNGGYFSYTMKVDESATNELQLYLSIEGSPVAYRIFVDDTMLVDSSTPGGWPPKIYLERIELPGELVSGKDRVTIKFVNCSERGWFKVYNQIRMVRKHG